MRVRIAVSFELPPGATRQDAVDYVADAGDFFCQRWIKLVMDQLECERVRP